MKPRVALVFLALVSMLALSGCRSAWSEYDDSLYEAFRSPGPEAYKAHSELLRRVIEESESDKGIPPPGVYAEYGYYLARLGRAAEAKKYFKAEVGAYPESAAFCQVLERMVEGKNALPPEDAAASGKSGPTTLGKERAPKAGPEPSSGTKEGRKEEDAGRAEVPHDAN
jgi:hypothetical protein